MPGSFARVANGMCGEGKQVGHHRQVGRPPAHVSEIVHRIAPVGPGHVECRVPDPPSGASAGGGFGDITVRDVEVGDEAVAAGLLAVGLGDPDLRPGGAERIGVVAQGQIGRPPVSVEAFARTPARGPAGSLWHRAVQVFVRCPAARWPAYEDKIAARGLDRFAGQPAGMGIAAQTDQTQSDHWRPDPRCAAPTDSGANGRPRRNRRRADKAVEALHPAPHTAR